MEGSTALTIRKPDDFHVHLRQGPMLAEVLPFTARVFARALVMPNTTPPITDGQGMIKYQRDIRKLLSANPDFTPLGCLCLTDSTTVDILSYAQTCGAIAAKLYPECVSNVERLAPIFEAMQKLDMVLSIHGELPDAESDTAEYEFLTGPFWWIYTNFPELKIVWEHVSNELVVNSLEKYPPRVGATITAHHLVLTRDDVLGKAHNYCRPPAKGRKDREALVRAVTSGNPKFFFGSDSAPHHAFTKGSLNPPPGIFSAPVALQILAQVFESANALDKLENFVYCFGAAFYGLPLNGGRTRLVKSIWQVPYAYACQISDQLTDTVVPFMAGRWLRWKVVE